jgi:hypothetical protein
LASAVGERLSRRDLHYGNLDGASFDIHHVRLPQGGRDVLVLLSSGNHDLGDQPVRLRPGVGQIWSPRPAEELLQGSEQAGPDRCVVLGDHRETTVITT